MYNINTSCVLVREHEQTISKTIVSPSILIDSNNTTSTILG
jgi:hypothetical protein